MIIHAAFYQQQRIGHSGSGGFPQALLEKKTGSVHKPFQIRVREITEEFCRNWLFSLLFQLFKAFLKGLGKQY